MWSSAYQESVPLDRAAMGSMTSLDVSNNRMGQQGVKLLEDAVREREGFKLQWFLGQV